MKTSGRMLRLCFLAGIAAVTLASLAGTGSAGAAQKKEYLSEEESDKNRDAYTPAARIKLFMEFAEDRLKKFDYELNRKAVDPRRAEVLNALLNAYVGCVDDGADQISGAPG